MADSSPHTTNVGQPVAPRGWWGRNWKWVLPVGIFAPLLLCGSSFFLIFAGVSSALRSSEVTTHAVERAQAHPEVTALLGAPIEVGSLVSGSIEVNDSSGQAALSIPISGPNGKATIEAEASRSASGVWEYSRLEVVQDGAKRIDLLDEP